MSSSPYSPLLRLPVVRLQAGAGLLAQVTQGAAAIGIILVVRHDTGSLALAGGVVGALSIAAGLARPLQGRLMDRRGAPGVMAVCGVLHPAALAAIVGVSRLHGPSALLVAFGFLAGAALPPVSASMRVEWAKVVGAQERTAAYSLVYLTQELAILTGPLILAALIAAFSASFALIALAAMSACGTLGYGASVRAPSARASLPPSPWHSVLRIRGMQVLLAVAALIGAVIGGLEVAAPTFATAHRSPAAAGLLIAALSGGGVIGAAIYGSRTWRASASARLLLLLSLLSASLALMVAAQSLVVLGALLLLAGLPLNPALTTFSLLVDQHLPGRTAAEAFGWLSTAISCGTGAGSAIAAAVSQHQHDARAALIVAAISGAASAALSVATRETLGGRRTPAPAPHR